jgi:hypothetical protein
MGPVTHGLVSWWVANARPLARRDRLLVFLAGVLPDLDGLPIVVSRELYFRWHHIACHNLGFGLVCFVLVAALAEKRLAAVGLACLSFHLHLAADYFGSGGWDGRYIHVWALPYLYPLVGGWEGATFVGPAWYWNAWQWPLASWINQLVSMVGVAGLIYTAVHLDRTWFEFVAPGFDLQFCATLRKWFGGKGAEGKIVADSGFIRRSLAVLCVVATWACVLAALHADGNRLVERGGGW